MPSCLSKLKHLPFNSGIIQSSSNNAICVVWLRDSRTKKYLKCLVLVFSLEDLANFQLVFLQYYEQFQLSIDLAMQFWLICVVSNFSTMRLSKNNNNNKVHPYRCQYQPQDWNPPCPYNSNFDLIQAHPGGQSKGGGQFSKERRNYEIEEKSFSKQDRNSEAGEIDKGKGTP